MFKVAAYTGLGDEVTSNQYFANPVEAMDFGRRIAGMASVGKLVLMSQAQGGWRPIATLDGPGGKWH